MFTGVFAFYLLLFITSIYFHPQFVVNIAMKDAEFGLFIAYFSAVLIGVGGFIGSKRNNAVKSDIVKSEKNVATTPEIVNGNASRERSGIKSSSRPQFVEENVNVSNHFVPSHNDSNVAVTLEDAPAWKQNDNNSQSQPKYQPFRTDL